MVNIKSFFNKVKGNAKDEAAELSRLRKERLAVEGRVKIKKAADNERARIAKAKQDLKKGTKAAKFVAGVKTGLKAAKKEYGEYKKSKAYKNNPWR